MPKEKILYDGKDHRNRLPSYNKKRAAATMTLMTILSKTLKTAGLLTLLTGIVIFLFMQQSSFGKLPSGPSMERIIKSPNYQNGAFVNVIPTPMMSEDASYLSMAGKYFQESVDRSPTEKIEVIQTDLKALSLDTPQVIWFGHSSYLLILEGKRILVDPVFSERASPVQYFGMKRYDATFHYATKDFPDVDIVVITHDHYDHLDYNSIIQLKDRVGLFIAPLGVGSHLRYWGIPSDRIKEFDWWEGENILPGITLTATPARHFSGRGLRRNKTLWASWVLQTSQQTIFIGGDSGYDKTFKEIGDKFGPFDIAMLECGQYDMQWPYIHMAPEEVVQASLDLRANTLLPVHWGKFTLALHPWKDPIERLTKQAKQSNVALATPKIGEPVHLQNIRLATPWWE